MEDDWCVQWWSPHQSTTSVSPFRHPLAFVPHRLTIVNNFRLFTHRIVDNLHDPTVQLDLQYIYNSRF